MMKKNDGPELQPHLRWLLLRAPDDAVAGAAVFPSLLHARKKHEEETTARRQSKKTTKLQAQRKKTTTARALRKKKKSLSPVWPLCLAPMRALDEDVCGGVSPCVCPAVTAEDGNGWMVVEGEGGQY